MSTVHWKHSINLFNIHGQPVESCANLYWNSWQMDYDFPPINETTIPTKEDNNIKESKTKRKKKKKKKGKVC